jgi:hypothetical protein
MIATNTALTITEVAQRYSKAWKDQDLDAIME